MFGCENFTEPVAPDTPAMRITIWIVVTPAGIVNVTAFVRPAWFAAVGYDTPMVVPSEVIMPI